jgi:hypothetical protein
MIHSKFRLLNRLQNHIVAELRIAKSNYVSDHDLVFSLLDATIDTAGLFTLVIPYTYTRMFWFLVVFVELTCYAVIGATLNVYSDWVARCIVVLVVNNIFGLITYACNPFTELLDKWLEWVGRLLISIILIFTIVCAQLVPQASESAPIKLFKPWESFQYIVSLGGRSFGVYQTLDITMVIFFYSYVFYVLYVVGVFGVVERMVQSFQFSYHDHILDFLVENLDQRTFGFENMFTGLQLVQQWDDIIRLQRRYALLAWPDVRPPSLASTFAKLFEIKWASLFNLTLNNLRSSLGLTVLHTVMFSADGDVARWIIHTNPSLLLVEDSQNDTPITIALKECAYFLLAYGEQNDGFLDDGTEYTDEQYAIYYPEVDDLRDDIYTNGEFVHDLCIGHLLTSTDLAVLAEKGHYVEPEPEIPKVAEIKPVKLDLNGNRKLSEEELDLMRKERKRKNIAKELAEKALREKQSVFAKRFPEDDLIDNYEIGQVASWSTVNLNVPDSNLYLDTSIVKKTIRNNDYSYELPDFDTIKGKLVKSGSMKFDGDIAEEKTDIMVKSEVVSSVGSPSSRIERAVLKQAAILAERNDISARIQAEKILRPIDKDLQYLVRTTRKVHHVEREIEVPMTHEQIKLLVDWDKRPKRRRGSSARRDSAAASSQWNGDGTSSSGWGRAVTVTSRSDNGSSRRRSMSVNSDAMSTASGEFINKLLKVNSAKADKDTKWRICKFAEILMSEEMSKSCSKMRWKLSEFKAFNKLASIAQGKVAQNLAMTCSLNAPPGFVRVSDWSLGPEVSMFDEAVDTDIPMAVKAIVAVVGAAESLAAGAQQFVVNNVGNIASLRGRKRLTRRTRSLSHRENEEGSDSSNNRLLSDRIIQYFAESYVCSNSRVNLDDAELSHNGRIGWRAIARALRLQHCSFVLPSLFVPPKQIRVLQLILTRNDLDCGDAVLLADIFWHQLDLVYVDLSYNRIGGRGMSRICTAIRDHPKIHTFLINHNNIG